MDENGVQFGLAINRDSLRLNIAVNGHNRHTNIGVNIDTDNKIEIVLSVNEPATRQVNTKPITLTNGQIQEWEGTGQPVVVVANCIETLRTVKGSNIEMHDGEGDDQDIEME
ncbi:hypothetical protein JR316_0009345 [Psilocybe cubensis]|uniref:Uncharacterized protein n=2 Tax=Psilocybe cubensis TaxID=181762 RepID=A0ACB8GTC0_PSICU|nr:hypothetical protein JR316_0009345 [Psilocybe cubensis]KAH9478883.1 hypothetical protein JR316_0009345 [Psilocybe cubensis]